MHFGTNLTTAPAGSAQMFLIVSDAQAARDELLARGVEVSEIFHFAGWNRIAPNARVSGRGPGSYATFVSFNDPDGNTWLLQEITTRLPGRVAGDTTYFVGRLSWRMRCGGRRWPTASTRRSPVSTT